MKTQFAHIKNRAKGVSTRTLAVMLCFVMLLTAVGAGTMMTAFSAKADVAASTAVADGARTVADIADGVDIPAADDSSPLKDLAKKVKGDADIAETGWTSWYIKGTFNGWNPVQVTESYNNENGKFYYETYLSNNSEFGFCRGSADGTFCIKVEHDLIDTSLLWAKFYNDVESKFELVKEAGSE